MSSFFFVKTLNEVAAKMEIIINAAQILLKAM